MRGLIMVVVAGASTALAGCGAVASGEGDMGGARELARTAVGQMLDAGAFEVVSDRALARSLATERERLRAGGRVLTPEQERALDQVVRQVFGEVYSRQAWEDALIPLYLSGLSIPELRSVVRHQESEIGQKLMVIHTLLVSGGDAVGQRFVESRQDAFSKRLSERLTSVIPAGTPPPR